MRTRLLLLLLFVPVMLFADGSGAAQILDKAVAKLKSDLPVSVSFVGAVYDEEGVADEQYSSLKGMLKIADDGRYAMLSDFISVWCDGNKQWNYMPATNEIYVTAAGSAEAQNFSPFYLMELYKQGYVSTYSKTEKGYVVTLVSEEPSSDLVKVVVTLTDNFRIDTITMFTSVGSTKISLDNYKTSVALDDADFVCPVKDYPNVEIIDLE